MHSALSDDQAERVGVDGARDAVLCVTRLCAEFSDAERSAEFLATKLRVLSPYLTHFDECPARTAGQDGECLCGLSSALNVRPEPPPELPPTHGRLRVRFLKLPPDARRMVASVVGLETRRLPGESERSWALSAVRRIMRSGLVGVFTIQLDKAERAVATSLQKKEREP